ncbi:MAG: 50S ribosomal protein L3 N(5)-glutamine methyltransferase [Cycloclasticus sp.]|nr:50S ribosomal protein L3 N(5)-glutamine methyltransferase [Cycloclasticus sp.]MBQ0790439.1 50S ribosomal protein L3 N(5)-glutamine methyltransferase [Cycloclasticus sp.]
MTIEIQKNITIKQLIEQGAQFFDTESLYYGHGTFNSTDEAAYIVLTLTGNLPLQNDALLNEFVTNETIDKIISLFNRRVTEKMPAAYLLGEAWFAGLSFIVDDNVLIPRSPFAELIGDKFVPWVNEEETKTILDLCTGGGCIGIACATFFPEAQVELVDISGLALAVAQKNILKHGLSERVRAIKSDLFENLKGQHYDLIVTNPPYVGHDELSKLPDEFYKEPQLGLDGGLTGLTLVHNILANAAEHLNDGGVLYVEVGNTDEALQACYPTVPFLWQEFDNGGHGIFMLTKSQLLEYQQVFNAKINA